MSEMSGLHGPDKSPSSQHTEEPGHHADDSDKIGKGGNQNTLDNTKYEGRSKLDDKSGNKETRGNELINPFTIKNPFLRWVANVTITISVTLTLIVIEEAIKNGGIQLPENNSRVRLSNPSTINAREILKYFNYTLGAIIISFIIIPSLPRWRRSEKESLIEYRKKMEDLRGSYRKLLSDILPHENLTNFEVEIVLNEDKKEEAASKLLELYHSPAFNRVDGDKTTYSLNSFVNLAKKISNDLSRINNKTREDKIKIITDKIIILLEITSFIVAINSLCGNRLDAVFKEKRDSTLKNYYSEEFMPSKEYEKFYKKMVSDIDSDPLLETISKQFKNLPKNERGRILDIISTGNKPLLRFYKKQFSDNRFESLLERLVTLLTSQTPPDRNKDQSSNSAEG